MNGSKLRFLEVLFGVYYVLLAFSVFNIITIVFLVLKMVADENLLNNKTITLLDLSISQVNCEIATLKNSFFVLHQSRNAGLNCTAYFICVSWFLLLKQSFFMYLWNNNHQWTEAAKDELNFPTQISVQSHHQNQTLHHYIADFWLCNPNRKSTVLINCVCFAIQHL